MPHKQDPLEHPGVLTPRGEALSQLDMQEKAGDSVNKILMRPGEGADGHCLRAVTITLAVEAENGNLAECLGHMARGVIEELFSFYDLPLFSVIDVQDEGPLCSDCATVICEE